MITGAVQQKTKCFATVVLVNEWLAQCGIYVERCVRPLSVKMGYNSAQFWQ